MKKLSLPFLVFILVFALSGCGKYYDYKLSSYVKLGEVSLDNMPELKTVTDKEITIAIKNKFSAFGTEKIVTDKAAEEGDYVTITAICYDAETQEELPELNKSGLTVKIGADYITEGFTDKLAGHKTGDEFSFEIEMDSDYESMGLSGKKVRFVCSITEVVSTEYPEFTDEFVKEHTEFSTYAELYESVKAELESQYLSEYEASKVEKIWNSIKENSEITKIPNKELELYVKNINNAYLKFAEDQGLAFSDYLEEHMRMTEEEFNEFVNTSADEAVREDLVINAVAQQYGIELSDDDYKLYLDTQKDSFGFDTSADFEEYYGELVLRQLALETKVSEYLLLKY